MELILPPLTILGRHFITVIVQKLTPDERWKEGEREEKERQTKRERKKNRKRIAQYCIVIL
jgi:hypothetical protein